MGEHDSLKKLKRKKKAKKTKEEDSDMANSELAGKEGNFYGAYQEKMKKKDKEKKAVSCDISHEINAEIVEHSNIKADEKPERIGRNKKSKKLRGTKKKNGKRTESCIDESNIPQDDKVEDKVSGAEDATSEPEEEQLTRSRKKRKGISKLNKIKITGDKKEGVAELQNSNEMVEAVHSGPGNHISVSEGHNESDMRSSTPGKPRNAAKRKKMSQLLEDGSSCENLLQKREDADEIYQMSSGDEDNSKGMKKWILQYHQSRPGLKVLQEKIDDFILAYEEGEEQARKQREAEAAEGRWTVVVHHKGRKKTTEAESGIAVGSVAQAAVIGKMAKKKTKEVGQDFYRFQKREAHRNELMMLQNKFEQDKLRIQQMRAARKFRPY